MKKGEEISQHDVYSQQCLNFHVSFPPEIETEESLPCAWVHLLPRAMETLLRLRDVEVRIGFCGRHIRELIREGQFPEPIRIQRSVRWPASEVEQWINEKIRHGRSDTQ